MTNPTTCPYCNTVLETDARGGTRTLCPRCGEPLPMSSVSSPPQGAAPPVPTASPELPATRYSNRAVGGIVVAVMAVMFVVGLVFALWTKDAREKNHARPGSEAIATPIDPAELPGLGYLPADSNVVAAVRPADLLAEPLGKRLFESPRPGGIDFFLSAVEKLTGVEAANIDHLVAGARVTGGFPLEPPSLVMVVWTRRPYAAGAVTRALKDSDPKRHHDRPLFLFDHVALGKGFLWCPNERRLIFVFGGADNKKTLEAIPRDPWKGSEKLGQPLQKLLRDRVERGSLAWIAGTVPEKALLIEVLKMTGGMHALGSLAAQVTGFTAAAVPEKDYVRLAGAMHVRDFEHAVDLQHLLEKSLSAERDLKVHGPSPVRLVRLAASALSPGIHAATGLAALAKITLPPDSEALWVTWQTDVGADRVRGLLDRGGGLLRLLTK